MKARDGVIYIERNKEKDDYIVLHPVYLPAPGGKPKIVEFRGLDGKRWTKFVRATR